MDNPERLGQYRAWGALKQLDYSNGQEMQQAFDDGLRPTGYSLTDGTTTVMDKSYQYYKDGGLKFVDDNINSKFDRSYSYDHQSRLKDGKSSSEASGTEITGSAQIENLPYRQSESYNAFGDMTERYSKLWVSDTGPPQVIYSTGTTASAVPLPGIRRRQLITNCGRSSK